MPLGKDSIQKRVAKPAEAAPAKKAPAKKPAAKAKGKKSKKKAKKSIKGLVITLCLECAGIVAIILWWILRIL